jgi:hypothetical protein
MITIINILVTMNNHINQWKTNIHMTRIQTREVQQVPTQVLLLKVKVPRILKVPKKPKVLKVLKIQIPVKQIRVLTMVGGQLPTMRSGQLLQ